ncbi:hypothetical protein ES706_00181 [subsurface metagenome]|nr:hypothetical protein [Hadesarchaea archaeon]
MKEIDRSPIILADGFALEVEIIAQSVERVNNKFRQLKLKTEKMALNVFEIIDFRMISGLIGETLVSDISDNHAGLERNPNIDGYPDLLNASKPKYRLDIERWKAGNLKAFVKYPYGGIEVKNTFGTKKAKTNLAQGQTRLGKINNKLDWKAHHTYTNNLLALFSDFIDGCPQIVAVMFSDSLSESDWKEKQNPRENSTMTSFSVIEPSGWEKLRSGMRLCRDDPRYLSFFGLEASR